MLAVVRRWVLASIMLDQMTIVCAKSDIFSSAQRILGILEINFPFFQDGDWSVDDSTLPKSDSRFSTPAKTNSSGASDLPALNLQDLHSRYCISSSIHTDLQLGSP